MTNLTANLPRQFRDITGGRGQVTLPASGALFQGAAVELDGSGNLQNLTGAGTTFRGFLDTAAAVAGDRCQVSQKGPVRLTVTKSTNWAATDVGVAVYGSDGNTFTLTAASNQQIGKVEEIESGIGTTTAVVWVYFEGGTRRSI
jgi:hypothetical protein